MKKLIKNYLAKLQENDKKGFSLVELIIVMAIMAILVGVVASQVLPYMEKSRISKDQENLASIQMDISSAVAMSGESCAGGSAAIEDLDTVANQAAADEFCDLRSLSSLPDMSDFSFKSKAAKKAKKITVTIDESTGEITVALTDSNGGAVDPKLSVSTSNTTSSSSSSN